MYCQHCERKHEPDARYCSLCGRRLPGNPEGQETAPIEDQASREWHSGLKQTGAAIASNKESKRSKPASGKTLIAGLLPAFIFVVTAAAVVSYYLYEVKVNRQVESWHSEAAKDAIAGKYDQSLMLLEDAVRLRPKNDAVLVDLKLVQEASSFQRTVDAIGKLMNRDSWTNAEPLLEQLKQNLRGREEQSFTVIREQAADLSMRLTVFQIKSELEQLQSVEALIAKLNLVKGLSSNEALELKRKIEERIEEVCAEQAEELVDKKSFSDALAVVQQGIENTTEREKLKELYDRILADKLKFEQEEQQRIENAMQKAAEEDLINKTAAVELLHIETELDENGSLHINGQLKNAATRPIYSVTIEYTVHDSEGKPIESGTAKATPDFIEAGENFNFSAIVTGIEDPQVKVVVDHATWYLD